MLISYHQCDKTFVSCPQVCIPRQVSYFKDALVDHENTANCHIAVGEITKSFRDGWLLSTL